MAQNKCLQASRALLGHDASPLHSWCIKPLLYKGLYGGLLSHCLTMHVPTNKFFYLSQNELPQILLIPVNRLTPASQLSSIKAQVFISLSESLAHTNCAQSTLPDKAVLQHCIVASAFRAQETEEEMLPPFMHEFCDQNAGVKSLLALLIEEISVSHLIFQNHTLPSSLQDTASG